MDNEIKQGFAPYDLSKTRKYDRNTEQRSLCIGFYSLACKYYEVAKYTLYNLNWMEVTLANIAFSCELFLKSLLFGFGIDFRKKHELKELFESLPIHEQQYIKKNISLKNRETEFDLCIKEQNDAFTEYRYVCEAKAITGNFEFLFAFADILKFVHDCLEKENRLED